MGGLGCVASSGISHLLTFLMTLQSAAVNSSGEVDPKNYVDLSLRPHVSLAEAETAFKLLPIVSGVGIANVTLQRFVSDYFDPPGSELERYLAIDYNAKPQAFLRNVKNDEVLQWAYEVHSIWFDLMRQEIPQVAEDPDRFTLVPLTNPVVVPGSRFREIYYWDSFWSIRGLVVSRMVTTARGIVDNLLSMVETYGFVPNGARKYYLNRSQPPLLSEMVKTVFLATGDVRLLKKALPILVSEHSFWTSRPHNVVVVDAKGVQHSLSRYYANWNTPRPESSTIDREVAESLGDDTRKAQLYNDIATGAESGWDFSSRWMADRYSLDTLRTSQIVPADLNALVFQMERNIALFAKWVADNETGLKFSKLAQARRSAIEAILWNDEMKQWNDYWLPANTNCDAESTPAIFDKRSQNADVFASNFIPVWCGLLQRDENGTARVDELVAALKSSGLLQPAGIATSVTETGQQWDYPNGWAPLQHMIIEGLAMTKSRAAKATAKEMAVRWLRTNYASFVKTGAMHEKYDVRECGASGGGGEYAAQTGFGWTNGVVLDLLRQFGWPASRSIACSQ